MWGGKEKVLIPPHPLTINLKPSFNYKNGTFQNDKSQIS